MPSPSNGFERSPRWRCGIVDDRDRLREDLVAEPILQKACAARDRWPRNRTQQVRNKPARDARVEHHRATAGRHFFGAQALDRPLAGAFADFGRVAQIGCVDRAREIVIALHSGARTGNDTGADPLARPRIKAGKAVGGGKPNARAAPSGLGAFGIGDAGDGERCFLGGARPFDQDLGARLLGVEHVEARPVAGDLGAIGDAAIRVLGDRAGHRDCALNELVERLRRAVTGRHHRLLTSDKHPEP